MVVIKPIEEHQIEQAKQIVMIVSLEIWQGELSAAELRRIDSMSDISNVKSHYLDNRGLFVILVDEEQIVGIRAIRQLSYDICELKRS
jgi:putative acetyltransferase